MWTYYTNAFNLNFPNYEQKGDYSICIMVLFLDLNLSKALSLTLDMKINSVCLLQKKQGKRYRLFLSSCYN
jgi:hypothetical protein